MEHFDRRFRESRNCDTWADHWDCLYL